ncbi:MAG TPA: sugar phosphate isomerase/epimerase [Thermomicrobiales bacterium]|nr:sugar phosphate isomerase/epimerase [Thermomicrobiales bacterium]
MTLIGCGQLTWKDVSAEQVLAEIALAGYDGAPGSLTDDRSAEQEVGWFAEYQLVPAPPYFSARWWLPEEEEAILAAAGKVAQRTRDLGCDVLYVAATGMDHVAPSGRTRRELAGKVTAADGMTADEYAQFGEVLSAFAEITLSTGVTSSFHPHVGTVIETAAELAMLLDLVTTDALALGLDTGHIAWAGDDPVVVCNHYLDRISTLHLKDVNDTVRQQGIAEDWTYPQFTAAGVFAELGEGMVDFPAILTPLLTTGFDGWLIVETDVTLLPTALESARISREYLRTLGL